MKMTPLRKNGINKHLCTTKAHPRTFCLQQAYLQQANVSVMQYFYAGMTIA